MSRFIVPIVEGQGEVESVPELIRRIGADISPSTFPRVGRPIRVKRNQIVQETIFKRYLERASREGAHARVLILLDADGDCPRELADHLSSWAREARSDRLIRVVLAKREYEAWFIAAAESLVERGILRRESSPDDPETIRNAKGWIAARMVAGRSYGPPKGQAALTRALDISLARHNSPSFDKMYRTVAELIR